MVQEVLKNYGIKDVEIMVLLLTMLGMIICFSMLIDNCENRLTDTHKCNVEPKIEMCDDIDKLCPKEMNISVYTINYSNYTKSNYSFIYSPIFHLKPYTQKCENDYKDIECDCAKNTSTPCMMRCFECE
jgi:hypothetical protein